MAESVIVKNISISSDSIHPRGWGTTTSLDRKLKSYRVEQTWYEKFAYECGMECRLPKFYGAQLRDDRRILLLEDLNGSGYPVRKSQFDKNEVKACLSWLASFHAIFMGSSGSDLWAIGTYWYLSTRQDELRAMEESALKENASRIDHKLNSCRYKTILHGDAKVANFCFSQDSMQVAAVDFQYVGNGCGMKDVVYLFSSCMNEKECSLWTSDLIDYYFECLFEALNGKISDQEFVFLEHEWREMYSVAWADFCRFLEGWSPGHYKLNSYNRRMVETTLSLFSELG
ncbi:MAG: DUF1679 domain-containing protein [Lentisphaeria bacterium]|nr:DUF1679 domain-containing protein [Lentisphaeria bacterium]